MLITEKKSKSFLNGVTYALQLADGRPIDFYLLPFRLYNQSSIKTHTILLKKISKSVKKIVKYTKPMKIHYIF